MKKRSKAVKLLLAAMLSVVVALPVFALPGCGCTPDLSGLELNFPNNENVMDIAPETQNEYSFVAYSGITIGGESYDYSVMAREVYGGDDVEDGYEYWHYVGDGETLFLYELHNYDKGSGTESADGTNGHTFDIGLYGADHETGECVLYRVYENVYPTYLFNYTHENIVAAVDEENFFVILLCNGTLEVFDPVQRTTVYSRKFFADDAFANYCNDEAYSDDNLPYAFTSCCDLLICRDGAVELYLYNDDGSYAARPVVFDYDGRFDGAESAGDVVFVYYYADKLRANDNFYWENAGEYDEIEYELIYDTVSGEFLSKEELLPLLDAEYARLYPESGDYIAAGGEEYTFRDTDGTGESLTVTRVGDGAEIVLTARSFVEKSPAYTELITRWKPNDTVYAYPVELYAASDTLLVGCLGSTPGIFFPWTTPLYFFELDFDTGDLKYAGLSYDDSIMTIIKLRDAIPLRSV